ncbi:MAG: hypothetical protein HY042_13020 [Spirochaetia bacterium]|nr:hypothetical protein [Spirochaetia bacterium]
MTLSAGYKTLRASLFVIVSTAAALAALPRLSAETIFLRNGQYFTGAIVDQSKESITIRTADGAVTYPKAKVKRIVYSQTNEEERKKLAEEEKAREQAQQRDRMAREQAAREQQAKEEAERKRKEEDLKKAQEAVKSDTTRASAWLDARLPPPIWRSALLPGLGQQYAQEKFKSSIFSGGTATMILLMLYNRTMYESQRKQYLNDADNLLATVVAAPDTVFPIAGSMAYDKTFKSRQLMQKYGNRTNQLATGIVLLWAVNMVDIIWFRVSDRVSLVVNPGDNPSLGVRIIY